MNKKMLEIDAVLKRICETLRCKNDTELANSLNVGRTTVSSWRSRGSIPYAECIDVALREGASIDYLLTGRGYPKNVSSMNESQETYLHIKPKDLKRVTKRVIDVARSRQKEPDIMKLGLLRDLALYKNLSNEEISVIFDLLENAAEIYSNGTEVDNENDNID